MLGAVPFATPAQTADAIINAIVMSSVSVCRIAKMGNEESSVLA